MSKQATTLQEFLAASTNFSSINLANKNITDDDCAKLSAALKVNKTVTQVYLQQNQISYQGAAAIAENLKVNKTVTQVYLSQNQIGDQGAAAIAESLKVNKTVTQIYLRQNQIGDQGATAIAESLKANNTVQYLYLHQNQIGTQGAAAIAESLKANNTVQYLYLDQNQIGTQGLNLLRANWQGKISYLYVNDQTVPAAQPTLTNKAQKQVNKFDQDCFFTAFNNDLALVQKSLSGKGIDLNRQDSNGKTLLWHAAFFGREEMVKLLLEGGVQLNCFNGADKLGHKALEIPLLLKNNNVADMIEVAVLADHVYMMEDFGLPSLDLSLCNSQSRSNRYQFLERLKVNLLKNGIPEQYLAEHYKVKLQEYLKNTLPDNFADDIVILLENLHLGRAKVMDNAQDVLREIFQSGDAIDLVKLLSSREETIALMINSDQLDQAIHALSSIILTKAEKQVVDELLHRYDSLEQGIKDLIKQNHPTIENAAGNLLKATDLKWLKLPDNEQKKQDPLKVVKEAAKIEILEEEKVKQYLPETDLNITKIFTEGAAIQGGLADHNQTIRQVSELIRDGNDRLQAHTQKGILLLGDTGAGKSTLAHLLSGRKLQAIIDDETGELVIEAMQPLANIVIGHKMASETKIPNKCLANDIVIWDCPGFNDTNPVQEIANSFYIKKLFETTGEIKFVLVVPESDLIRKKGNNFLETLSGFMKVFSDIEAIGGSISLVITQVPPHKKLQHIKNSIEKILIDNESVTMTQRILVNKLVNSSLHLFHKPQCEGEFNFVNLFEAIESSSLYTKSSSEMANMSVSEKGLECSLPLLSTASSNFNKILEVATKAILEATDCLKANQHNLLAHNYHLIKDMVPVSIYHKDLALHPETEHFTKLDLLFRLKKILGSNQVGSMTEGLNVLQQVLETIAEYAESGNIALKNQIQDYGYCLKQQYEYVKFFASVCDKELPEVDLTEILRICQTKVAENLEFQVSSLHVDQSKLDAGYYQKAADYLENYPNSKPCIKLKALCYIGLAGIAEHNGDTDGAIDSYVKAIETNRNQPEAYEQLGKLFFSKGQYAKAIEAYKVVNNEFKIKACFKAWLAQDEENPDIMLKQAEYFESIGLFESAKKSYHHAFSLSKNETVKANALEKIGNIMTNGAALGQSYIQKAHDHDFFSFESVTPEFIHNLLGDSAI